MKRSAGRHETGHPALDRALGGGLVPGSLVVIVGATGIGKTHLGLLIANAGRTQEGRGGLILDLASRGDDQGAVSVSARTLGWRLIESNSDSFPAGLRWKGSSADLFRPFSGMGKRVDRTKANGPSEHEWTHRLQTRLRKTALFLYRGFAEGRRRVIVDGIEPAGSAGSLQHDFFDTVLEQFIRLEDEWLAREALRERFAASRAFVRRHPYNSAGITTVLLQTSAELELEALIRASSNPGGAEFNASTLVLMGWKGLGRSNAQRTLCIIKHRGSTHEAAPIPFEITARGLRFGDERPSTSVRTGGERRRN